MQYRFTLLISALALTLTVPLQAQAPAFGTQAAVAQQHSAHSRGLHRQHRAGDRRLARHTVMQRRAHHPQVAGRQLERRGERMQRQGARLRARGQVQTGRRLMHKGRALEFRGERLQQRGMRPHRQRGRI